MAEAVVDRLEVIEIEENQRPPRVGLVAEPLDERCTVGKQGQGISPRQAAQLLLRLLARCDVEHVAL